MGGFAWVTLATNDSYSLGALVLAHSLKQAGTVHQLAVLVTPGVTSAMREKLTSVFNLVQEVNILDSKDEANLRLLKRPELGVTFTKLHCWRLTQYEKCVFLDADTLVLQNSDELFEREELSAAPDVGWPDCFNSGVFVYRPSLDTYEKLTAFALEKGSFDGGDQGLLNLFFSDWAYKDISKHLPFIYNLCSTACYSYLPAYKQFGANAKIIHFIGATKPWLQYFNTETKTVQPSGEASHLQDVLQRWWNIFCSLIHPQLSPAMAGLAGAFAQLTLGVPRTQEQEVFDSLLRKQAWEVGNIDYLGRDSFDNIWSKITQTLSAGAPEPAPPVPAVAPAESQSQSTALPQEEAKPDEPPITPVDISTAVDSLSLEPTEPTLSVESSIPAEEAIPPVTQTVPIETKTSPQELVQVITKESVSEPAHPVTPQKETPLPVETVTSSEKEVEKFSQKEVEPVLEPAVVPPPVVEPPVIPQPIVEPSVVSQPVETLQPAEQPPVVSGPTQKESEPALPPSTIPKSATKEGELVPPPEVPEVVPKETQAQVVKEAEQPPVESQAAAVAPKPPVPSSPVPEVSTKEPSKPAPKEPPVASQAAAVAPKPSVPSSPVPEVSTKEPSKPVPKEPAPKAATPKEAQKGKPVEAPAAPVAEKSKQATVEAATSSEPASTPTPPPRKTDKPKKVASKPKK